MEMVNNFINKHTPILEGWMNIDLENNWGDESLDKYLSEAKQEWCDISVEEKQISYLESEEKFWLVFHSLLFATIEGISDENKESLIREFDDIKKAYKSKGSLPEKYAVMRPS